MQKKIKIGDKTYYIEVSEIKDNLLKIKVNDKDFFFAENNLGEIVSLEKGKEHSVSGGETYICWEAPEGKEIKAPLAGTVSKIFVKEKEEVKVKQKVATLIAMKMENEIISEGCGRIKEIKVKENQFVNSGDVLIVLE